MNGKEHILTKEETVQNALMNMQDKLYAMIRMLMIRNTQDALDVLQDTNAAILGHLDQYDPSKPVFPWFYTVAMNQVRKYFRGKSRSPLTFDTDLLDSLSQDVEAGSFFHGVELEEYLDAMKHCMGNLPPVHRNLMQERYIEDRKIPDLSAKYHLSIASLAHLFCRTRQALKTCIQSFIHIRANRGEIVSEPPSEIRPDDFLTRLGLFIDGSLPEAEVPAFLHEIAAFPEKRVLYMEQAFLHAFVECRKKNLFEKKDAARPTFRVALRAAALAAAFAALLGGMAVWRQAKTPVAVEKVPQRVAVAAAQPPPETVAPMPRAEPAPQAVQQPATTELPAAAVAADEKKEEKEMKMTTMAAAVTVAVAAATPPQVSALSENFIATRPPAGYKLSAASTLDARAGTQIAAGAAALDARSRTAKCSAAKKLLTTKVKGTVVMLM